MIMPQFPDFEINSIKVTILLVLDRNLFNMIKFSSLLLKDILPCPGCSYPYRVAEIMCASQKCST